ncbi:UNKNOWN [Stylonychia lemnae]|uniref:COX assembly mitochondrial protein n=1 Tax=Stylonychia lemnae TaxID=5949 RepID=A0A078AQ51_STYLE|nr:UNKNOWN [Stylonychia lemnae]|eukprot:CDW84510.1 UNKNOWN [Stylonychia lemnae]
MPKLNPEPDYIIKTRPPMWDDWRLNIFRGVKENRLKLEANKIARRKCWETGQALEECSSDRGMFKAWTCKKQFDDFLTCCYHEQQVELDKLRRDTKKHTEWWWLNIYDEHGEVGLQAHWKPEESLKDMWIKNILYNWIFKPTESQQFEQRQERLEELRKKQGVDIDIFKDEFNLDFHIDAEKAQEYGNFQLDKKIYNV